MHIFWESSDWAGARVEPNITCLTWAPTSLSDMPHQPASTSAVGDGVVDNAVQPSETMATASADARTEINNEDDGHRGEEEDDDEYGWLGCGSQNGTIGITRTRIGGRSKRRRDESPLNDRVNFNLRGHSTAITLAVWNRSPLKLATCDESGMIYVWVPYEERWSVELVNERGVKVRDFCWSPTGHAALICYEDNFVLIGSATGNRIWSHNYDRPITCGVWSPDSRQVFLGTEQGTAYVLSEQGIQVMEVSIRTSPLLGLARIRSLCWSASRESTSFMCNSTMAATFDDGSLYLLRSHDDVDPVIRKTELTDISVRWSMNGEFLAVLGTKPPRFRQKENGTSNPSTLQLAIYDWRGVLRQRSDVPFDTTEEHICSFTWAHDDKAIVLSHGGQVRVARVMVDVASLTTLSSHALWRHLECKGGNSRRERIDQLPLPMREMMHVNYHNSHIIQCRVPSEEGLTRECCVGSDWRWYCTIKPISGKRKDGTAFILYMEHMSGLVPILAGKLTNRLLPEFTIQLYYNRTNENMTRLPSPSCPNTPHALRDNYSDTNIPIIDDVASTSADVASPFVRGGQTTRSLMPPPTTTATPRHARSSELWRRSKRQLRALVSVRLSPSQAMSARLSASTSSSPTFSRLEDRLAQVTSNVWCTRFKVVGMSPDTLSPWLGQVTYKTSVLHLQPRQMTVHVVDMRHRQALTAAVHPPLHDDMGGHHLLGEGTFDMHHPPVAPTRNEIFAGRDGTRQLVGGSSGGGQTSHEMRVLLRTRHDIRELRETVGRYVAKTALLRDDLIQENNKLHHETTPSSDLRQVQCLMQRTQHEAQSRRRSSPPSPAAESTTSWSSEIEAFEYIDDDDSLLINPDSQGRLCVRRARALSDNVDSIANYGKHHARSGKANKLVNLLRRKEPKKESKSPSKPLAAKVLPPNASTERLKDVTNMLDKLTLLQADLDHKANPQPTPSPCTSSSSTEDSLEVLRLREEMLAVSARVGDLHSRLGEGGCQLIDEVHTDLVERVQTIRLTLDGAPQPMVDPIMDNVEDEPNNNNPEASLQPIRMNNRKANVVRHSLRKTRLFGTGMDAVSAAEPKPTAASMAMQHTADSDHVLVLQNKTPFWNEQSQVYQLDFGGRVTQESAKNFQIEHNDTQVMQFGRIEGGAYTLDFQAPFSAAQAFAVALASITQRLK